MLENLLPFVVIVGMFYFLLYRPAQSQKRLQALIDNLKIGDKIVTTGGLYGTVAGLKEDRIQVKLAENVKVEMARNAVAALQHSEDKD